MPGIYIHIPFCNNKCHYCDFFARKPHNPALIDKYVNAVCKEIEMQKDYLGTNKISTIYFGGGTPSLLSAELLKKIFGTIDNFFDTSNVSEITLEANPEDLTPQYLNDLKRFTKINRLSIGVQSFFNNELKAVNRKHTAKIALQAIKNAQKQGFYNISADLIFGLPFQTLETWKKNLEIFFGLDIPHLSAYSLTVEKGTVLWLKTKKGIIPKTNEDLMNKMYEILMDYASENDFEHYEISNFARKGFKAVHNSAYWENEKYLGIGAAAHSFDIVSRQWNIASIPKYINAIYKNEIPAEKEILSAKDKFNELIITGLRTSGGISFDELTANKKFYDEIKRQIKILINDNLLKIENNSLKLTRKGLFIADSVMSELIII